MRSIYEMRRNRRRPFFEEDQNTQAFENIVDLLFLSLPYCTPACWCQRLGQMLGLPTAGCFVASHWRTCTFTHPALEAPRCTARSCAPLLPASDSQNSVNVQHMLPPRSAARRWRCCATARVEIGSATAESALEQWAAASGITSPNLRVADFGGEAPSLLFAIKA